MDFQHQFFEACEIGDFDKTKSLLFNETVNPADDNNYAIQYASNNGHYNIVELLLGDYRVNPADDNNLAIRFASYNDHFNVVKLFLKDKRVNPSDNNNWAIKGASKNGHYNIVKLLSKDKRVNPADDNNYAIQLASKNGYYNVVKLLLRENRVINSFNIDNINYINNNCSKTIINFYKKYFNLYRIIDIFLLINYICNTTIKLSINYKLPIQLKDFILHYYVYNYRKNYKFL